MKTTSLLLLSTNIFSCFLINIDAATPVSINSTTKAVTVFYDRAEITREAEVPLKLGTHTLHFENLSHSIDPDSIRLKAKNNITLIDVKVSQLQIEIDEDPLRQKLLDTKTQLEDEINSIDRKISRFEKSKKLFEQMINYWLTPDIRVQNPQKGSENIPFASRFSLKEGQDLLMMQAEQMTQVEEEIHQLQISKRPITNQLDKTQRELAQLQDHQNKSKIFIEATISVDKDGTYPLALVYQTYNVNWHPSYTVEVAKELKGAHIQSQAEITQQTGETWTNVDLKLSTARNLSGGGRAPQLQPEFLTIYNPQQGMVMFGAEVNKRSRSVAMKNTFSQNPLSPEKDEEVPMPAAANNDRFTPISTPESTIEFTGTAQVFVIPAKATIPSDNSPHRIGIKSYTLTGTPRYESTPKLSTFCYLKMSCVNNNDAPFLPGSMRVFFNGEYIAQSNMELVQPKQEFWLYLGIDEGIKVTRKLISAIQEEQGILTNKTKVKNFDYLFEIENNKNEAIELVLWDQIPISNDERIVVDVQTPPSSSPDLLINEHKFYRWLIKPNAQEKIKLPFRYSIRYPRDLNVEGL
jgi:uncharacterized protein (TIGR02231 family)